MLCDRGHAVHLAFQIAGAHHLLDAGDVARQLCAAYPRFSTGEIPVRNDGWGRLARELRSRLDYLRYVTPEYRDAVKLRDRAGRDVSSAFRDAVGSGLFGTRLGRRVIAAVTRALHRAIPDDPAIGDYLRAHQPDVLVVTPLVDPGAPQTEYLRSARAQGIPTALCVASWDNLTNKGLIHGAPDLVTVWNEAMKTEAVALHGVPASRVVVTGAQPFDHWFGWRPSGERADFCARVGLPPDRPYLLYLCSSAFIAPDEASFVRTWLARIRREGSEAVRTAGILVRPHPQHAAQWQAMDLQDPAAVIWPKAGAAPSDARGRTDYFDSIFNAAAVVGVNTTAEIESAIIGRRVHTLLAPEFHDTQEGTLHFEHLRRVNGGLLHVASSFDEHLEQLDASLRSPDDEGRGARFVAAFVRPFGPAEAATPRLVDALESTANARPLPDSGPWWAPVARVLVRRMAARRGSAEAARVAAAAHDARDRAEKRADSAARKAARQAAKQEALDARMRQSADASARQIASHAAEEQTQARAFEHYAVVREHVRRQRETTGETPSLTEVERRTCSALEPLLDATPATIGALRRWCEPLGGVRAADYEPPEEALRRRLGRAVHLLQRQGGSDLFVSEPTTLGGFGCTKGADRYNEDTVRYFTALVALRDAAILDDLRHSRRRRLVWEIGGGWGGFAYQFKTLCPNVTYVITGQWEVMLVSAVYLMTLFPQARVRFWQDPSNGQDLWQAWEDVDFVFAPERAVPTLQPPQLDLTIDLLTLQLMSAARAQAHVQRAFDLDCRYFSSFSSLEAEGNASDVKPPSLRQALERWYWPHPVPPRTDRPSGSDPTDEPEIEQLVGWRRLYV